MGLKSGNFSRKVAFALVLVILTGLFVGLFIIIYEDAKRAAIDRLNDRQFIHARQAAFGIEEYFRGWTAILSSLSRLDDVIEVSANGKSYMDLFNEAHQGQIQSVSRVSEKGIIIYTVPDKSSIGADISGQKHVREILAGRRLVVSDVFRTVQGKDGVALHVPVFRGTEFKGTIAVVIDFRNLARRFIEVIRVGDTGYAWVVSREGTMLYSPVPGFTGRSIFDICREYPSLLPLARELVRGGQGSASYEFDRISARKVAPVRKHGVYLPIRIGNTYWPLVVASSEDEVISSLASFRNRLILVMGVLLLGGVILSAMGAKAWLIVREEGKRRKAEEGLKESEARYRELFERNPAPMLIYEKETLGLLSVNEGFLHHYGYDACDVATLRLQDLYPESEKEAILALAARVTGHAYAGEWHHVRKDGSLITIVAMSNDISYLGRKARIAVISDITKRKQAEDQLRELKETLEQKVGERTAELEKANATLSGLDRLKSLFIASMSHELRTPLNSIIGFTGIILQGLAGPLNPEQSKQLGMVKGSARHLLDLITDIIDLSKIEAGKIALSMGPFDLVKTACEVLDGFRIQAGQKTISLSFEGPETLVVTADERRIRQVLINLVGNAVKFTEKGNVSLSVAERGVTATVSVRDTGPGIRPEDIGKLFGQFSQVGTTMSSKNEGTGLGLYLSRKLMNLMGGDIRAESAFGLGSTFTATLPIPRGKETS
jgi:PAS domain S-box-containing protein